MRNPIRQLSNKINGALATRYASRASEQARQAASTATGARNAAHGSTMNWGQMSNPAGMRRDQENVSRARSARATELARSSRANSARSRRAASRIR